jgi:propanol-preferring alcohol dehydrogenase
MVLNKICDLTKNKNPLVYADFPEPIPKKQEILVEITVCGVCHTELDEIEGRTPPAELPVILGHQVVGKVAKNGPSGKRFNVGDRVGIAWIFYACGECPNCLAGYENLCPEFLATGRNANGGYSEFMTVHENFAYPIPDTFSDAEASPLLCSGAIGYRSLMLTNIKDGQNLGLTGFGASGHLVLHLANHLYPNSKTYIFARSENERKFGKQLGAFWTGDTEDSPPEKLDAIIDTTPVWKPIVKALGNLNPGGRLVINAIRKEDVDKDYLLSLDYPQHLWLEREIKSVANVARNDVSGFLKLAAQIPIKPEFQEYGLQEANKALLELKEGKIKGAKVLRIH